MGNLWTSSGQLLTTATFANETATGWQQVSFPNPIAVTANTVYVASYHTNTGNYAANSSYFTNSGVDNPPIHLLQNGVSGGDGVYAYGASSSFPTNTYQSTNYWVGVVFNTSTGSSLSITSTAPANGATGVSVSTAVTARFNNSLNSSTVNSSTFSLKDSGNNLVPASYSVSATTATLTPSSALAGSTTYRATLTTGVTFAAKPAIAIDAKVFADRGTASTTVTPSAFSTTAGNELLLAFVSTDWTSGSNTTVSGVTGGGLTWVLVRRTNTQSGTAEIW